MTPFENVLAAIAIVTAASLAGLLVLYAATRYFERKARRERARDAARMEPE